MILLIVIIQGYSFFLKGNIRLSFFLAEYYDNFCSNLLDRPLPIMLFFVIECLCLMLDSLTKMLVDIFKMSLNCSKNACPKFLF